MTYNKPEITVAEATTAIQHSAVKPGRKLDIDSTLSAVAPSYEADE